jgi:putative membrane protein
LKEEGKRRILVLCVDLDDDVGNKAGIKTPVVGRGPVIDAGLKLALSDPEESDANAIFASVKTYDKLVSEGYGCQVALVAGSQEGEPYSSMKVIEEIKQISKTYEPTDVFVVTDGFGDEDIIPVIKANLPVSGVVRVIVKHSKSVEESYVILGRYIKMLFTDERFKKYTLGFSGILLILYSLLSSLNLLAQGVFITAFLFGLVMLMKGYNLDIKIKNKFYTIFETELPLPQYVTNIAFNLVGYVLLALGTLNGIYQAFLVTQSLNAITVITIISNSNLILGTFFKNGGAYILLGLVSFQLSRFVVTWYVNKKEIQNIVFVLIALASSYPMILALGDFLINPGVYLVNMAYYSITSLVIFIILSVTLLMSFRILKKSAII